MTVYESTHLELIGGARVTVEVKEVENWDSAPNLELVTRFYYRVEGEQVTYGYARVIEEGTVWSFILELYRAEVERWARLQVIETKGE